MTHPIQDRILKQAGREYRPGQRLAALAGLAPLFLLILPLALIRLGRAVDRRLDWPRRAFQPLSALAGGLAVLGGYAFAMWSIYTQFTAGRGTPVPLMATQKLVIQPPYSYCRNPMALGTILCYAGVAVLSGSPGALLLVIPGTAALLANIKRFEEREMVLRFGQEYLDYQQRTPFLIPRRPRS